MVVDSEWIGPVRRLGKRLLPGSQWRSAKGWLTLLIAANVAYVGVGFSSQGASDERVGEQPATELPGLRLVSEMTASENQPAPAELVCRSWGPFNNSADFAGTQARILAAGGVSNVRHTVVSNDPDYLVYVGRPGEAEDARRTLEELKSQAIESALIIRGRFNNTLSVGVFSRADRANVQRERVAKLGYEVGIEEIDRSYDVFHLEGRVPIGFESGDPANGPCADIAQAH